MKQLILKFSDSNMARYSWSGEFYLASSKRGKLTLSAQQILSEDAPKRIDPVRELHDGVDVYEALSAMVSEAGYSLEDFDLHTIANEIAILNAVVAEQFSRGPMLVEERDEKEKKKAAEEREAILRPYREIIDNYVLTVSDRRVRGLGGSNYGTYRGWVTRFIEDYVGANGQLPTGEHDIRVLVGGTGYSGGPHDFSDLK